MQKEEPINLFYEEPNHDRWFKYDRFLRNFIRRIFRGKARPGGQMMVALELMHGLDKLKIPYRFNDYAYARKNPNELIGVIGKTFLLEQKKFKNPILFGASVFSHPLEEPELLIQHPNIYKILVPGLWMKKMFEPYYGDKVGFWPVGIDTVKWDQTIKRKRQYDFLVYDKIRWELEEHDKDLFNVIENELTKRNLSYTYVKYGSYTPEELLQKIAVSNAVIFLCEHETQGLAYQQILATNTPILAYDQEEFWLDPSFYPDKVKFGPVSAVPYWDKRCGIKFKGVADFKESLEEFNKKMKNNEFNPRAYILENLTLEKCAENYYKIYRDLEQQIER